MKIGAAPGSYDPADQAKVRKAIADADTQNFKKGQDVQLLRGERLILASPNGSRWLVGVSNAGAIVVTGPL